MDFLFDDHILTVAEMSKDPSDFRGENDLLIVVSKRGTISLFDLADPS